MARPTLFNEEISKRLLNAARRGAPRDKAASIVGITPRTLHTWLMSDKPEFKAFSELYLEIEANYDLEIIERLNAEQDYRALDKLYSKRNPENKPSDHTTVILNILAELKPHISKECFDEFLNAFEKIFIQGTD